MKKLLLLAVLTLTTGMYTMAQNSNAASYPIIKLGKVALMSPTTGKLTITLADLKANSKLIIDGPNCKVEAYSFSVLPKGKDFIGPYTVQGTDEFTEKIKSVIASLNDEGGRIFIENIRLNCDGVMRTAQSIIVSYK